MISAQRPWNAKHCPGRVHKVFITPKRPRDTTAWPETRHQEHIRALTGVQRKTEPANASSWKNATQMPGLSTGKHCAESCIANALYILWYQMRQRGQETTLQICFSTSSSRGHAIRERAFQIKQPGNFRREDSGPYHKASIKISAQEVVSRAPTSPL